MSEFNTIRAERVSGTAIVSFNSTSLACGVDEEEAAGLFSELTRMLDEQAVSQLIMKFNGVTHISSGTIALFITLRNQLVSKGGDVCLCQLGEHMTDVLERLNLAGTVFHVADTEAYALHTLER